MIEPCGPSRVVTWGDAPPELDVEARFSVRFAEFLEWETCHAWTRAVYRARERWVAAFGGEQFSLGNAWYTHLEEDREGVYFASAAASDALVEATLPGMQSQMLTAIARATGGSVARRAGWCGPGVHVFPSGEAVSRAGGVVHFDTEGLSDEHVRARGRALSVVAMLHAPQRGGGLRLWAARYSGDDAPSADELESESELVEYGVGELVIFDSYRLHQIQPFGGRRDRVSVTAHAAEVAPGSWEVWF